MAVFEVWDPAGKIPSVTFQEEEKATDYRDKMEKTYKRDFRLKKHFGDIKPDVKDEFEIFLGETGFIPGDTFTLEKGIFVPHAGVIYRVKKMRVREDGTIVATKKEVVTNGLQ